MPGSHSDPGQQQLSNDVVPREQIGANLLQMYRYDEIAAADVPHRLSAVRARLWQFIPFDILLEIFFFVVVQERPWPPPVYPMESGVEGPLLGWIRLSHVCREWRYLCLNTPSLWAHHFGALPKAAPTHLERAGKVPLDICVGYYGTGRKTGPIWSVDVKSLLSRSRSISWNIVTHEDHGRLPRILSGLCLPSLKLLKLYRNICGIDPVENLGTLSLQPFLAPRLADIKMFSIYLPYRSSSH